MPKNKKKIRLAGTTDCLISDTRFQSILRWARFCAGRDDYNWTEWEAGTYYLIRHEIRRQLQLRYWKRRHAGLLPREALVINLRNREI